LKKAGSLSVGLAAAEYATAPTPASAAPGDQAKLPHIQLGEHSVSRLICGANPFNGGSHLSVFFNRQLREYYTPEQILKTLRRCQEVGINCWQSSGGNFELYRRFIEEGGQMHYISLAHAKSDQPIEELRRGGCIGVAHHGEVTDRMFKRGEFDEIGDYLKRVKDAGVLAGISTHMPAVVDAAESKGWDFDFYMTCVYERHRSAEELEKLLGHVPIPVGEVYLTSDPPRMYQAVRSTKRPCLAFKILAAGRLSERRPWVEQAFRDTLGSIKSGDAVIVGMYDQYTDQPAENAAMVRRFSASSRTG
jgi:hypothetical protein